MLTVEILSLGFLIGIEWFRFTSIYLDLEFRFEFRFEEDLI